MRILVLGANGYLGWPTSMYLASRGHEVCAMDNDIKKDWENRVGAAPLLPTPNLFDRCYKFESLTGNQILACNADVRVYRHLQSILLDFNPEAIIHYAEQPSAPYSMKGKEFCVETVDNNIVGTLCLLWAIKDKDIHLVKLGTMGEYGTPNIDIEEGWIDIKHNGREDRMLFPKKPGSFYHASKVAESQFIEMACRLWGLKATDLNQGVVYGIQTVETEIGKGLHTAFHYDGVFGTALNRFIAQGVTQTPITQYGKGGQTRGWLNIVDTIRCVELACLNPPSEGEFRVFNQFTEQFSIKELADRVASLCGTSKARVHNPRVEAEQHYYNAKHVELRRLGLEPHMLTDEVLMSMIEHVRRHKDNIILKNLHGDYIQWK